MTRVRVVGAGLSGLSAAWWLVRRGIGVDVIEGRPRSGGLIQTVHLPEGLVETGANAFVWTPAVERLFASLDVAPMFARDASRRRYIFRAGTPRRWPLTPLETAGALARLTAAWATGSLAPRGGESVGAWGRRVAGRAATEWLLSPAIQGIYGAGPDNLSAAAIAASRRGGRIRLCAPRTGMGAIIDALERALLRQGATITCGRAVDTLDSSVPTLVCTGAAQAATLIAPHAPEAAAALRRIRSVPLVTATAFFAPARGDLRGFGTLFPHGTAQALGVLFNTEIFEGRGTLRSETWIYGNAGLLAADPATMADTIRKDRMLLTRRRQDMTALHVTQWTAALPVYNGAVIEAAAACAALPPWLGLCGNYLGRIGVSALIERAESEAGRIAGLPDSL